MLAIRPVLSAIWRGGPTCHPDIDWHQKYSATCFCRIFCKTDRLW